MFFNSNLFTSKKKLVSLRAAGTLLLTTAALLVFPLYAKAQISFPNALVFTVGTGPRSLSQADFNGDGKLDIVTANYSNSTISVLLGLGEGVMGPKTDYAVGLNPQSVATGD